MASAEWFLVLEGWAEAVPRKVMLMFDIVLSFNVMNLQMCYDAYLSLDLE